MTAKETCKECEGSGWFSPTPWKTDGWECRPCSGTGEITSNPMRVPQDTIRGIQEAKEMLDSQPVPTKGRLVYGVNYGPTDSKLIGQILGLDIVLNPDVPEGEVHLVSPNGGPVARMVLEKLDEDQDAEDEADRLVAAIERGLKSDDPFMRLFARERVQGILRYPVLAERVMKDEERED